MAGAALFLASPLAAYVVGQTLVVDGGLILHLESRQRRLTLVISGSLALLAPRNDDVTL